MPSRFWDGIIYLVASGRKGDADSGWDYRKYSDYPMASLNKATNAMADQTAFRAVAW